MRTFSEPNECLALADLALERATAHLNALYSERSQWLHHAQSASLERLRWLRARIDAEDAALSCVRDAMEAQHGAMLDLIISRQTDDETMGRYYALWLDKVHEHGVVKSRAENTYRNYLAQCEFHDILPCLARDTYWLRIDTALEQVQALSAQVDAISAQADALHDPISTRPGSFVVDATRVLLDSVGQPGDQHDGAGTDALAVDSMGPMPHLSADHWPLMPSDGDCLRAQQSDLQEPAMAATQLVGCDMGNGPLAWMNRDIMH